MPETFDRFELHMGTLPDRRGVRHAIYPTAERTLCGLRMADMPENRIRTRGTTRPDCQVCRETAETIDAADRSAPPGWFRKRRLGGAPGPAVCEGKSHRSGLPCRSTPPPGHRLCHWHVEQEVAA